MDTRKSSQGQPPDYRDSLLFPCDSCEAALRSPERHQFSFLILDQLTVPVLGCDAHIEQFATICGYTTSGTAELIEHRPAGGVHCPSCQLATHNPRQPVIPVADGAVAVVACPDHQSELFARFRTGLETQQQLTTALDTSDSFDVP